MLTVYKASAGSGKTFQLVAEYLKLLLKNPVSYRHILAVTFTNKATNEMKSRILEQLYLLANHRDSDYTKLLKNETSLTEKTIRERARRVLKNILHDYNRFSVSTIDSFTQRVIKAFNREMGISPHFTLELDNDLILEEAVDRLLAKVDSDKQLRKWLVEYSKEKIRENRSHRIEEDIKLLGGELFKEKFQLYFPLAGSGKNTPYTRENLESFRKELDKITAWFENTLRTKGKEGVAIFSNEGLEMEDFSGKGRGIGGFWVKLAEGKFPNFTKTVADCAEDPEKWYAKTSKKTNQIHQLVETRLRPLLQEILFFYYENLTKYQSATEVRKQLRVLGILTDLKEEVTALLHEKGVLQLSDSNLLLSKIIGDSDSPFIYEKIGTRFNYYMLDEFQDTSSLQWENFKPLVANALAEGHPALLVGDVKQSIYRWRNSDWNILASQINSDFPHYPPTEIPLEKNWRSERNIIDFNNAAIGELKKAFENFLFEEIENEDYQEKFRSIYQHFRQEPGKPEKERKGKVEISFLPEDDFEENSANQLVEEVKQLQDKGLKASETAILIRKNKEGAKIIETFLAAAKRDENKGYNLSVLSNESLFLFASQGVNLVMRVVELLIDPENKIQKTALLHLWLSWLKPLLNDLGSLQSNKSQLTFEFENSSPGDWLIDNDFEIVFDKELGATMEQLREKVLLTSLDETVTEICASFGLFDIQSELPFLQTLIDQAAGVKTSLSNDLSNLLFWWNEKGYKTSVTINEEVDSVRLLTVHKAKGLEFEAVLLPFFNWDTSWTGNQAPLLWCRPETGPFNRFPLLPVKAGSKLSDTIFQEDYFEEKVNSFTDTLNLVYVAFTRAKSALFVHCKKPREKKNAKDKGKPGKSVNALLAYSLKQMANGYDGNFAGCRNEENTAFRYGELPAFSKKEGTQEVGWIKKYHHHDFSNRIRLRLNSEDFLITGEQNRSVKNTGKLVHEILAEVETADHIQSACNKAFREGRITEAEQEAILKKLEKSLENPAIKSWFDGSYKVLNERNLLAPEKILRPDRIMVSGKQAVVVDYKWGEKMPEKYRKQVIRYAETLKASGFGKVEGYLWYINQDEVEKVV